MTSCPVDCGMPPVRCGDGVCSYNSGESCSTCPNDCMCMTTTTVRPTTTTTTVRPTTTTVRPTTTTTTVPACAAPKHYVQRVCCAAQQNYVVDGKCSSCGSFSVDVNFGGKAQGGNITNPNSNAPKCLSQLIANKKSKCTPFLYGDYRGRNGNHYGSCLLMELAGYDAFRDWGKFFSGSGDYYYSPTGQKKGFSDYKYGYYYRDKLFYKVDSSGHCNLVKDPGNVAVCNVANLTWYVTPISLLIETNLEEFQKESRIVNFALSPDKGDFSIWKGSEKAPLLVYNPEHNGKINSATQLFGNWTFGGKKEASLSGSENLISDKNKKQSAWTNGYEALGTLDINKDGKVSDKELLPLALWFDENRNAKSEPGEVKPITETGITALYYQQYVKDAVSQDIIARIGFDRTINGKTVSGTSIDWHTTSAASEMELAQKQIGINSLCSLNNSETKIKNKIQTSQNSMQSGKSKVDESFLGTWAWKTKTSNLESGGVLVFADDTEGGVRGISLVELSLDSAAATEEERVIMSAMLNGKILNDSTIEFSYNGEDGTVIESKASLSADKSTLNGSSIAYIVNGKERITKAEYQWSAIRY